MSPFTPYQEAVLYQVLDKHGWIHTDWYINRVFPLHYPQEDIYTTIYKSLADDPFVFLTEAMDLANEVKLLWK